MRSDFLQNCKDSDMENLPEQVCLTETKHVYYGRFIFILRD